MRPDTIDSSPAESVDVLVGRVMGAVCVCGGGGGMSGHAPSPSPGGPALRLIEGKANSSNELGG